MKTRFAYLTGFVVLVVLEILLFSRPREKIFNLTNIDVGDVWRGEIVSREFNLRNISKREIKVQRTATDSSNLTIKVSKEQLSPGESATLFVNLFADPSSVKADLDSSVVADTRNDVIDFGQISIVLEGINLNECPKINVTGNYRCLFPDQDSFSYDRPIIMGSGIHSFPIVLRPSVPVAEGVFSSDSEHVSFSAPKTIPGVQAGIEVEATILETAPPGGLFFDVTFKGSSTEGQRVADAYLRVDCWVKERLSLIPERGYIPPMPLFSMVETTFSVTDLLNADLQLLDLEHDSSIIYWDQLESPSGQVTIKLFKEIQAEGPNKEIVRLNLLLNDHPVSKDFVLFSHGTP